MAFVKNKKSKFAELSDISLVQQILKSTDRQLIRNSQEELYDRYSEIIYRKCYSMLRNTESAKDLAHDILIKIFLKLDKFRGDASLHFWVLTITYNHCVSHIVQTKRMKLEALDNHSFELTDDDSWLQQKILKDLQLDQLEILISQLNEHERIILLLRYKEGKSLKEIGDLLQLRESAVKMRLKRSREHLTTLFRELEYERG